MFNLLKIIKARFLSLPLIKSITYEGIIMENELQELITLTNQEKVNLFIVAGFYSMIGRLLYQHWTTGTDV